LLHNNAKVEFLSGAGELRTQREPKGTGAVALHIINLSTSSDREDSVISSPSPSWLVSLLCVLPYLQKRWPK